MAQVTQASPMARLRSADPAPEEMVALVPAAAGAMGAVELTKGRAEVVRAYQGRRYADVRTYYWDGRGPDEALRPTRKGISLVADRLPALRAALDALAAGLDAER
jgi:hypothetical protein